MKKDGAFTQYVNGNAQLWNVEVTDKYLPNWEVEHYLYVEYTDGTISDTLSYTPNFVKGCVDSTEEKKQWY